MYRIFLFVLAATMFAGLLHAQEGRSATRAQLQHKYNVRSLEKHLKQTEASLLQALNDTSVGMQTNAVQTLRELEQVFPEYPFSGTLTVLERKLKDENTDPIARRLVALALDGLHSEAGDAIISDVANSSQDKGLQFLCKALLVKGGLYKEGSNEK
jgi:hypothetical protein